VPNNWHPPFGKRRGKESTYKQNNPLSRDGKMYTSPCPSCLKPSGGTGQRSAKTNKLIIKLAYPCSHSVKNTVYNETKNDKGNNLDY